VLLTIADKLTVGVPEYLHNEGQQTHLYLLPPNAFNRIETNKDTRLRLGYSMQSVYDDTSGQQLFRETATPLIQLVNDEAIQTFDKYGKVTLIIEENRPSSNQIVMLNVFITDIFNIAVKHSYQALSFPLGSQVKIPIRFQNLHAHAFADNIEGISLTVELSHPRVLSAKLDQFN